MHINALLKGVRKLAQPIDWETDATRDGCQVSRFNDPAERYLVDFAEGFTEEGWQQFDTDQDASYFGQWVNPRLRLTLAYCEGDWTLVECPSDETYNREIERLCEFFGEGRICLAIGDDGATEYRQDRSQFRE